MGKHKKTDKQLSFYINTEQLALITAMAIVRGMTKTDYLKTLVQSEYYINAVSDEKVHTGFYLPAELKEKVVDDAMQEGMTIAELLLNLVIQDCKRMK
jgi:hypothetical protein